MVREFVRETLEGKAVDLDHAVLVAGEMATNSIRHAPGPFAVVIKCSETELAVGISDTNPIGPPVPPEDVQVAGGYGMQLVAHLAEEWQIETEAGGKTVWAWLRPR
ncbi:MAG: ATP-binding protein [Acidimicrobiaceae bacterium]|nr:ATP-binding protein [Acidimicrobiaceae bacterium]